MTESISPLDQLARRASSEPFFLGFALAEYQRRHALTDEQLAERLAAPVDALARLRLCRRPAAEDPHFDEHVRQIAEFVGCDESALRAVMAG